MNITLRNAQGQQLVDVSDIKDCSEWSHIRLATGHVWSSSGLHHGPCKSSKMTLDAELEGIPHLQIILIWEKVLTPSKAERTCRETLDERAGQSPTL